MKQSLLDANLDFKSEDNNFEYMVLVRTERKCKFYGYNVSGGWGIVWETKGVVWDE